VICRAAHGVNFPQGPPAAAKVDVGRQRPAAHGPSVAVSDREIEYRWVGRESRDRKLTSHSVIRIPVVTPEITPGRTRRLSASSILCDNTGGDTGDTTGADTEKNLTLCGLGPCLLGGGEAPPYSARHDTRCYFASFWMTRVSWFSHAALLLS